MKIDINWLVSCYGFVLSRGEFSFIQWAEKIAEAYSLSNPANYMAYNFLLTTPGKVTKNHISYTIEM